MLRKTVPLFLVCLLSFSSWLQAQETRAERKQVRKEAKAAQKATQSQYLVFGLNGRYGLTQDFRMSKLTYQGSGIGLVLAHRMRSPKIWDDLVIDPSYTVQNASNGTSSLQNVYGGITYRHLRRIKQLGAQQDWNLYLGGEIDTRANVKLNENLGNSAASWEGTSVLALSVGTQKDVNIPFTKFTLPFDAQLAIPLFAYVYRGPEYSLSGLDDQLHAFTSLWGLPRAKTEIGMTIPFSKRNPNCLRVAYRWDFYAFNDNEIHPLRMAQHGLALELLVNLSQPKQ